MFKFLLNGRLYESWHHSSDANRYLAVTYANNLSKQFRDSTVLVKDKGTEIYRVLTTREGKFSATGDIELLK